MVTICGICEKPCDALDGCTWSSGVSDTAHKECFLAIESAENAQYLRIKKLTSNPVELNAAHIKFITKVRSACKMPLLEILHTKGAAFLEIIFIQVGSAMHY